MNAPRLPVALAGWFVALCLAPNGMVAAAQAQSDLPALARTYRTAWLPVTPAELSVARARLRGVLDTFALRFSGDSQYAGWTRALDWPQLAAQASDAAAPDAAILAQLARRADGVKAVWPDPTVEMISSALADYLVKVRASLTPAGAQEMPDTIDRLAASLEAYQSTQATADLNQVRQAALWLETRGQAADLTRALRERFSHANGIVRIFRPTFEREASRAFNQPFPVDDVIVGTHVRGQGVIDGTTQASLTPDPAFGIVDVRMAGTSRSSTRGFSNGADIRSESVSTLSGIMRLSMNSQGLAMFPAQVRAATNIHYNDIAVGGTRIRQRRVSREVHGSRSQAERESSEHAERFVAQQWDAEATRVIDRWNRTLIAQVRDPLLRSGHMPGQVRFRTSDEAVDALVYETASDEWGAPSDPPLPIPIDDVGIELHQSFFDHLARDVLGGRTMTGAEVERALSGAFGLQLPAEGSQAEADPWTVRFAADDPLTLSIDPQRLTLALRIDEFRRAGTTYPGMTIVAAYEPQLSQSGIRLIRTGEVEARPPGTQGQLAGRQLSQRRIVQRSFEPLLTPVLDLGSIVPGQALAGERLSIRQYHGGQGWLAVGLSSDSPSADQAASSFQQTR